MPTKRITISLPPNLGEALLRKALKDNVPVSTIVGQALHLLFAQPKTDGK